MSEEASQRNPDLLCDFNADANTYFAVTANAIVSSMLSKPTETLLDPARNGQVKGTKGTLREENRLTVGTLALHVDEARRLGESLGVGHAAASTNNANSSSRAFVYPIRIPTVISRDPARMRIIIPPNEIPISLYRW
jgi:hypothetical protein